MENQPKYWFRAKKYGWGWGFPSAWQGWVVLFVFFLLVGGGAFVLLPTHGPPAFVSYCLLLCVILMVICWATGEPPRWRWGESDSDVRKKPE